MSIQSGDVFRTVDGETERFVVVVGRVQNGIARCIELTPVNRIAPLARECRFGVGGLLDMERVEVEA